MKPEQQSISISKAGIVTTFCKLVAAIIACRQSYRGRYNPAILSHKMST